MVSELKNFLADLQSKKIIADHANVDNFFNLEQEQKCLYLGIDCTNDSLHIGHLFQFLQTVRFAQEGFKVILLLGGTTSKIGDPSDKLKERPRLEKEKLKDYYKQIKSQVADTFLKKREVQKPNFAPLELFYSKDLNLLNSIYQVLEFGKDQDWDKYLQYIWPSNSNIDRFQILDNSKWLGKLSFIDFIDQVGRNVTINYLLAKETIKQRVSSESGLSFSAFSYSLLQAYDFYYLYKNYGCHGQLGGSDQWGNLTTGLKLIKSVYPESKAFALTFNLLVDKKGKKISKSSTDKTIWISLEKTPFIDFYNFLSNMPDEQALVFLKQFTFLNDKQIEKLNKLNNPTKLRIPQRILIEMLFYLLYENRGLEWLKDKLTKNN